MVLTFKNVRHQSTQSRVFIENLRILPTLLYFVMGSRHVYSGNEDNNTSFNKIKLQTHGISILRTVETF